MAPQIFYRKPAPHEVAEFRAKKQDPFRLTEKLFSPIICLELLNPAVLCPHSKHAESVFKAKDA